MPTEFTPCLLLRLWSVYFTGTGGLRECELKAEVLLSGVSSFVFFFFLILLFSLCWDGMPGLLSLHSLYCSAVSLFVFELTINMFLEHHPTQLCSVRSKAALRMSRSAWIFVGCHLGDLWRKRQVRLALGMTRKQSHQRGMSGQLRASDYGRSAGPWEQGTQSMHSDFQVPGKSLT